MPKIRFTRDELYESEGRNKGPAFAEGEVITCTEDFAGRWTRRGSAEVVGKGEPGGKDVFLRAGAKPARSAPTTAEGDGAGAPAAEDDGATGAAGEGEPSAAADAASGQA